MIKRHPPDLLPENPPEQSDREKAFMYGMILPDGMQNRGVLR